MDSEITSSFDTYTISSQLGQGGMGTTWLVHGTKTERPLVLKQLQISQAEDWKVIELFRREANVLQGLSHPNIPEYIDFFESADSSQLFLVQSYIEGKTLRQMIDEREKIPVEHLVDYLSQVLKILTYLHELVPPVLHRDITPQNIIVNQTSASEPGILYLVDFGAVKSASPAVEPETVASVGTFGYMPPEQMIGQADKSSDLYSLGMTFISLASQKDISEIPVNEKTGRIEPGTLLRQLPKKLRHFLRDLTQINREERIPSAHEALQRLLLKQKRSPLFYIMAAGIVFILMLMLGWGFTFIRSKGEIRTLGGWFSGHGSTLSAMTATFFSHPNLISRGSAVTQLAFTHDGSKLVSITKEGELILWEVSTGRQLQIVSDDNLSQLIWCEFSPDGQTLHLATVQNLFSFDVTPWKQQRKIRFKGAQIQDVLLQPGHMLVATYGSKELHIYALKQNEKTKIAHLDTGEIEAMVFNGNGTQVAYKEQEGSLDHNLMLWDFRKNVVAEVSALARFYALNFSPCFRFLVFSQGNSITFYDLATNQKSEFDDFSSYSNTVVINPDSSLFLTVPVYDNKRAKLVSFDPNDPISFGNERWGPHHKGPILKGVFNAEGSILATASKDQTVRLWRVTEL
ncbi:protein kinase [candidate division CSSED10-310 bacterium]|uniref:non-specific serine/threonine protein kinase n=1 Tax=candidate division CSSED10-310 bacterium TaxID=2855610 RepID=A0ABV6YZK1_UNCC1